MEKAVFITRLNQLHFVNNQYTRLYYGQEFCERLIPATHDLKRILVFLRRNNLKLSLVTPYVTDWGLSRLEFLFEQLRANMVKCEVVVNDWGVLNLVNSRYHNLTPVLGRLLTKQKRGPRVSRLLARKLPPRWIYLTKDAKIQSLVFPQKLPPATDGYYQGANSASVKIIHNFLIQQRVRRIELDNTAQGLALDLPRGKISASIYLPYVYITTTFFCPSAGCSQKKQSRLKIKPCKAECQRYLFKLRHKTMPSEIILKGNTQFYQNHQLPEADLGSRGINRIVYQPEIPV